VAGVRGVRPVRIALHEEANDNPLLQIHIDTFSGRPTRKEFGLLDWRPGGGCSWFLPSLPMIGTIANQHQALSRRILREHALDFVTEYVCGPRMGRALHMILFNRQDPQECQRVIAGCRALMAAYGPAGYPISRVSLDFQEEAMARLETFPEVCAAIKRALDPKGILSPGRYGIG
jgi:4-cresol dehydrogenase (hydroxylating)